MASIQVLSMNERWGAGISGKLLVSSWLAQLRVEDVRAVAAMGVALRATHPRYASMGIVMHGTPMPAADVRKVTAEISRESAPFVIEHAMVLEGHGFWASTARLVISGINALSDTNNMHIFATIDEAAQRLVGELGDAAFGCDAAELAAAVTAFRTAHVAMRPGPISRHDWVKP